MKFWHRAGITLVVIVVVSWVVVTAIEAAIGLILPGYLAGVIGGLAGVPTWELLRRIGPKPPA